MSVQFVELEKKLHANDGECGDRINHILSPYTTITDQHRHLVCGQHHQVQCGVNIDKVAKLCFSNWSINISCT